MTEKEKEMLAKLKQKEADEKKEQAKKQRQFKDMCKQNFGLTPTEIADIIKAHNEPISNDIKITDFEQKIVSFYGLESELDKQVYLDTMLNENSKRYWDGKRTPNGIQNNGLGF